MTTANTVNAIEFGRVFREMLMRRLDDPMTFAPLTESAAYCETQQEYDGIHAAELVTLMGGSS